MNADRILAACGDRCDLCPRYTATRVKSEEELAKAAELWFRVGWRDRVISAEEIACTGCKPESPCLYGVRACAEGKKLSHCGLCSEYPCEKMNKTFRRSDDLEEVCRARCSSDEFSLLKKAFFEKRENLEGKV